MRFVVVFITGLLLIESTAFTITLNVLRNDQVRALGKNVSPLCMGRAAAVRAATKGKTDAKKAKVNGAFGKRIIMAVKQGGSPDPNANRALNDVIKQAKANK
jgi:hypothetical protein